jgi:16S rRNA pseudouridine516 synthase
MRLDKYVANNSGLSRTEAIQAIRAGRVCLDQLPCTQFAARIKPSQTISLDGLTLNEPMAIYWMVNKPAGVVCANSDAEHPTLFDLLNLTQLHPSLRNSLQIAGRLDRDTTGLVLVTSDGAWNHMMTSPNKTLGKRYRVTAAEPITAMAVAQIQAGMLLRGESKITRPAKIKLLDQTHCLLEITEGKYHQVKRMMAATGNRVIALHRETIGCIELDPSLQPGQHRALKEEEINQLTEA